MKFSGRVRQLAAAGAVLVAGLGPAAPAAAAVRYDPATRTGFADAADVRKAFGWNDATLAARAAGLTFGHTFWTTDTYAVRCGKSRFPVAHRRDYGRFELTSVVVRQPRRAAPTGYTERARTAGFRITGPYAGISGTSVAPAAGQPCPKSGGATVTRADLVSTATGWSLTVSRGAVTKTLRTGR